MKIMVDDKLALDLNETRQKVIQNDIKSEAFDADVRRRVAYVLEHKYEQCFKRLKAEWEPKLAASGVQSIPTDPDKFPELVFSEPDYTSRSEREALDTKI